MTENWKLQVSLKTPAGTLINVRADNPGELASELDFVITKAGQIVEAEQAFTGTANVAGALGAQNIQTQAQAPQQQNWGNDGYQQQPPPAFAPQQQAAPAAPQGPAPSCVHGQMQYRTGNGAKGPWQAYFCPTPKGTPNQCQAQFIRNR
jgi:hypothetical protein